jgi:predicted transcriptional regulator
MTMLWRALETELVIALLEEGPQTADEVAELIRRKRTAEHAEA